MNLKEEIITQINDRVYEKYTLCEKKASLEDVINEIMQMENEVESPYISVICWIKGVLLDIMNNDKIDIITDENGYFEKVIVKG